MKKATHLNELGDAELLETVEAFLQRGQVKVGGFGNTLGSGTRRRDRGENVLGDRGGGSSCVHTDKLHV